VNYQMIPEVQLIGEVTPIVTGERTVWAAGVRIFPAKNIVIDLLGTNSTSQFDLGELIAEPGTRFAASIQWKSGGHSKQNSRVNPTEVSEPSNSEPSSLDPQSSVEHLPSQNLTGEQTLTVPVVVTDKKKNLTNEKNTSSSEISSSNSSESSTTETNPFIFSDLPSEKQPLGDSSPSQDNSEKSSVGNIYITFTPITWHWDNVGPNTNDFLMGIGVAYDFKVLDGDYGFFNWFLKDSTMDVEFNVFRDSDYGYPSAYLGVGIRKNIFDLPLQTGMAMGLIYTTQLQKLSGSPVLPFVFPFLQTDFEFPLNLRVTYIPSVSDFKSQQVFFTIFNKIN